MYGVLILDTFLRFIMTYRPFLDKSTQHVIETLEETFNRYGKPEILQSDNGSQFVPADPAYNHMFQDFFKGEQIKYVTIPKGKPQKNGTVECHAQTVKDEVLRVFALPDLAKAQHVTDYRGELFQLLSSTHRSQGSMAQ